MAYNITTVARKSFGNSGLAILEVNTDTLSVSVKGKFLDGGRYHEGEYIPRIASLPANLLQEVQDRAIAFPQKPEMSDELNKFVAECWTKAQELQPWFDF